MEKTKKQQLVEKVAKLKQARQQTAKAARSSAKASSGLQVEDDREAIVRSIDDIGSQPQSRHDFDKQTLMSPNDVELWIRYVTFVYESEVDDG